MFALPLLDTATTLPPPAFKTTFAPTNTTSTAIIIPLTSEGVNKHSNTTTKTTTVPATADDVDDDDTIVGARGVLVLLVVRELGRLMSEQSKRRKAFEVCQHTLTYSNIL
jgi:hypothetical protein